MSILAELAKELGLTSGELRARLEASEELVPNYLTVDPATQQVGANFTGRIHAQGLDLNAGDTTTPPDTDRVRWLVQDGTGAVLADITAYRGSDPEGDAAGNLALTSRPYPSAGNFVSAAFLRALDRNGLGRAFIEATSDPNGEGRVRVRVQDAALPPTSWSSDILREGGASSFVQIGNPAKRSITGNSFLTWGGVNVFSNGTTIALPGAGGSVKGIALPTTAGLAFVSMRYVDNANGTITFFAITTNNSVPVNTTTTEFTYLIWGF